MFPTAIPGSGPQPAWPLGTPVSGLGRAGLLGVPQFADEAGRTVILSPEGIVGAWPEVPDCRPLPCCGQQRHLSLTALPRTGVVETCVPHGRDSVRLLPDRKRLGMSTAKADGSFQEGNGVRGTPGASLIGGSKSGESSCTFMLER